MALVLYVFYGLVLFFWSRVTLSLSFDPSCPGFVKGSFSRQNNEIPMSLSTQSKNGIIGFGASMGFLLFVQQFNEFINT
jgi:hypothetical protein